MRNKNVAVLINLFYLCEVKNYQEKEAMDEIFSSHILSSSERVMKNRYIKGTLSQKSVDKILFENGFQVIQEKLYTKKKNG